MKNKLQHILLIIMAMVMTSSCSGGSAQASAEVPSATLDVATFSGDSAMEYARRQVAFGPRTPGSTSHDACKAYLVEQLQRFGADTVMVQSATARAWDGKDLPISNIFAQYNKEKRERVILLAHYDTRPWADRDAEANHNTAIDGANDGASGVAVLLEIARQLGIKHPEVGVDILLTDVEDYGAPSWEEIDNEEESWCLGSQYFAAHLPYTANNMPRYGILLDMVGGKSARFHQEYLSSRLARVITAKVWVVAKKIGKEKRFVPSVGNAITDDHLPLIRAGIPVCNIIENNSATTGSFPNTWHTLADNIDNLDAEVMTDVGEVVLTLIYYEKP